MKQYGNPLAHLRAAVLCLHGQLHGRQVRLAQAGAVTKVRMTETDYSRMAIFFQAAYAVGKSASAAHQLIGPNSVCGSVCSGAGGNVARAMRTVLVSA